MSVLIGIIAYAVLAFFGTHAFAQVIDDDTKCASIDNIVQTTSPDQQKVKEIVDYIVETMRALDRVHGRNGKLEIFPQLTEDGRSALALIVTDRCRTRGSLTVADTAIETYEAIRATKPGFVQSNPPRKSALGQIRRPHSPAPRKWAHSHAWRQPLASALDQHPVP